LAREAAWRAYRDLLRTKPVRERVRAAALLREAPEREVEYLSELAAELAATKNSEHDLEVIRERLSNLLVTQGKFAEAIPHLREIYTQRSERHDPARLDAGLKLLDATLRSSAYTNTPDLIQQVVEATGREPYVITQTVAVYLNSRDMVTDSVRTRAVLDELRRVPPGLLDPGWRVLLSQTAARLGATEPAKTQTP